MISDGRKGCGRRLTVGSVLRLSAGAYTGQTLGKVWPGHGIPVDGAVVKLAGVLRIGNAIFQGVLERPTSCRRDTR
jgi:hypothetical protein